MKKVQLAVSALAFGLMAVTALPARADKDRNSMVTKQEFLDAMGRAYDVKMTKMKAGKDAGSMIKGDAMTKDGAKALINDIPLGRLIQCACAASLRA